MTFTALHRELGIGPGPLDDPLLDDAVDAGTGETQDLDWKSQLPPAKGLPTSEFPKDVAAMANSGGGLIIYGVRETQKKATERTDVGDFDENYERSLRQAAFSAIFPPVFGLNVLRLGAEGRRAVVVEVPASADGPHLVYRGEYFGAPLRNDADTVWMKERQIEAMYRTRFEERRHATEALDSLYSEASTGRDTDRRAWLIAVAHPRMPRHRDRLSRDEARQAFTRAITLTQTFVIGPGLHPLANVDELNPRPGLRRWVAVNTATGDTSVWRESWASIHNDGSVSLAVAVGGHLVMRNEFLPGSDVEATTVECAVADLMALLRATAEETGDDEYEVRVGIEWHGEGPLMILDKDRMGQLQKWSSVPLHRYTPVETTVNALESDPDYHLRVHGLAKDCVNQGGIADTRLVRPTANGDAG